MLHGSNDADLRYMSIDSILHNGSNFNNYKQRTWKLTSNDQRWKWWTPGHPQVRKPTVTSWGALPSLMNRNHCDQGNQQTNSWTYHPWMWQAPFSISWMPAPSTPVNSSVENNFCMIRTFKRALILFILPIFNKFMFNQQAQFISFPLVSIILVFAQALKTTRDQTIPCPSCLILFCN